jgi:hypothetical protein
VSSIACAVVWGLVQQEGAPPRFGLFYEQILLCGVSRSLVMSAGIAKYSPGNRRAKLEEPVRVGDMLFSRKPRVEQLRRECCLEAAESTLTFRTEPGLFEAVLDAAIGIAGVANVSSAGAVAEPTIDERRQDMTVSQRLLFSTKGAGFVRGCRVALPVRHLSCHSSRGIRS